MVKSALEGAMANHEETPTPSETSGEREIKIGYYGDGDIIGIFADQAIVSHATGLFTLLFYQMQIPPLAQPPELKALETIPARCVARIVITPELMEQFSEAIKTNIAKYNRLLEKQVLMKQEE
jgi:hypothetical protein